MDEIKQENLYISLIAECRKEVDIIRRKINIITRPQAEEALVETPIRTELEAELKHLLTQIKDLQKDIVV